MKTLILWLMMIFISGNSFATLTAAYTPVVSIGGSNPVLQNGSIYDTGTANGAGDVGIANTNPGQRLDVSGTVKANGFLESGLPKSGGVTYACFDGSGNMVSQLSAC